MPKAEHVAIAMETLGAVSNGVHDGVEGWWAQHLRAVADAKCFSQRLQLMTSADIKEKRLGCLCWTAHGEIEYGPAAACGAHSHRYIQTS